MRTPEISTAYDALHAAIVNVRTLEWPDSTDSMLTDWVICHASVMLDTDDATRYGYIVPEHSMPHHHLIGLLHHTLTAVTGEVD